VFKLAYIKEKANGRWKVAVYIKNHHTGKRKRKYNTVDSKKEAKKWAKKVKAKNEKGVYIDSENKKMADILRKWLEEHKKNIHENTYDGYKIKVESHLIPHLGEIKITNLNKDDIEYYFEYKRNDGRLDVKEGGLSGNSLKKLYIILKMAMQYAKNHDLIAENPVLKYHPPTVEHNEAYHFSEDEVEHLLNAAKEISPWMYRFIALDLLTGLRRSEISALTWEKVNLQQKYIVIDQTLSYVIGKGTILKNKTKSESSTRFITISDKAVNLLLKHKEEQDKIKEILKEKYDDSVDYVFAKEYGGHFAVGYFNDKFNEILDKANFSQKYGIHTLRHTFATLCIKKDVGKETLMSLLGHSSYSTTVDFYAHFDLNTKRKATDTLSDDINI